jgi:glutamyl-tRNA reductase
LVSVALEQVTAAVGSLSAETVVIVGSGSVAALVAASVRRLGVGEIVVVSRTPAHAARLAHKVDGRAATIAELGEALLGARLLVSCTASTGLVVPFDLVAAASGAGPLGVIDLALPHDVDPAVADLPGVALVALRDLAEPVNDGSAAADVAAVRAIVADEVAAFAAARAASRIAPTVVALRTMATGVVASELERLWSRVGELTPEQRDEIGQAVRRVADKLLHEPTVRVKALADRSPESTYADALAELFALDPAAVEAVTRPGDPT